MNKEINNKFNKCNNLTLGKVSLFITNVYLLQNLSTHIKHDAIMPKPNIQRLHDSIKYVP